MGLDQKLMKNVNVWNNSEPKKKKKKTWTETEQLLKWQGRENTSSAQLERWQHYLTHEKQDTNSEFL